MKKTSVILLGILIIITLLIVFKSKQALDHPYDPEYWKYRYEESQWFIPASKHIIGDDGLYRFVGYELANGRDPTTVNAEMPPLAKYVIGFSERFFGSPWLSSIIPYIAIIIGICLLAYLITDSIPISLIIGILTAVDPIIVQQAFITMLDSIQLSFLLISLILLTWYTKKPKNNYLIILSGISSGLFASSKFPALLPLILCIGILVIYAKSIRKLRSVLLFLFSVAITYCLSYLVFFLSGHSIVDFAKIQKWMFNFYSESKLMPQYGSSFTSLFFGQYRNLFSGKLEYFTEWTASWPFIAMLFVYGLIKTVSKNDVINQIDRITCMWIVLVSVYFFFIPFWTRYLVLLIPFLYIFGVVYAKKYLSFEWFIAFIILLFVLNTKSSFAIIYPTPKNTIDQFSFAFKHQYFRDILEFISDQSLPASKKVFISSIEKTLKDNGIINIDTDFYGNNLSVFPSQQKIIFIAKYMALSGKITTTKTTIRIVKENGIWKIEWNPKILPF